MVFFLISHRLFIVEVRPSSSLSTGCVVSLRGDSAIFCHTGSGRVGRVWSTREKSLGILYRGLELSLGHKEDRQWAIPLIYHELGHREDRQWAIPLSYHEVLFMYQQLEMKSGTTQVVLSSLCLPVFLEGKYMHFQHHNTLLLTGSILVAQPSFYLKSSHSG